MAQGNARREKLLPVGTNGTSDSWSSSVPMDSRWQVVPGSVKIFAEAISYLSWTGGNQIGHDDGAGNLVADNGSAITGTFNYATGGVTLQENGVNAVQANWYPWIEYYMRPATSPGDDFYVSYSDSGDAPLILHRYPHASFGARALTNHGTYCMMARGKTYGHYNTASFILKDPDFYTDASIMSEIAFRMASETYSNLGPRLVQRYESPNWDSQRVGYRFGPASSSSNIQRFFLSSGNSSIEGRQYRGPDSPINGPRYSCGHNIRRGFNTNIDNNPPNILVDDWHKMRMITTQDVVGTHIQLLMALGNAEVDKAEPVFQVFADIWHQSGNDTPIWTPPAGFPAVDDITYTWQGDGPHAYPPTPGYQGFHFGGRSNIATNPEVFVDDFRCYRMPA